MATRAEARDYVDASATHTHFSREQLLQLGRASGPALTEAEVADVMVRLDRLPDDVWQLQYGLSSQACDAIRKSFSTWPRD